MSDDPAAPVPDDDGSPPVKRSYLQDNALPDRSRQPPPVPSSRPVVKLVTEAPAESNVPVDNLIDMDEGESTTGAGNGLPTESAGSSKENPAVTSEVENILRDFLKKEKKRPFIEYGQMYNEIRLEQDRLFKDAGYKTLVATSAPHYNRNRYRDILPYDHNRVALRDQHDNPHGYMNASFIHLPDSKMNFIAAQAPLPATLEEWWKMIDEQKIKVIVMLCKLVELSKVKCERYWPSNVGETEVFGDYEIKLFEEKPFPDNDEYILRVLVMTDLRTSESRTIWQLHYREWPDHGCPTGEQQLLSMLDVMETLHEEHSVGIPILVHCSAGVGRTGTIIAVNFIREHIKAGTLKKIDILRLVCHMRKQRSSMVQTPDQFYFVHKCIAAYIRRLLNVTESDEDEDYQLIKKLMSDAANDGGVRLIPPPTPTTSDQSGIANQSQADQLPTETGQVVEDESDATSVPDFPGEPPAPQGPEDLSNSAAS